MRINFYNLERGLPGITDDLSVVHKIAAEHGGRIRLDSAVGKGTAFRIDLPRTSPQSA
jgi:signal transduction histidine kinase